MCSSGTADLSAYKLIVMSSDDVADARCQSQCDIITAAKYSERASLAPESKVQRGDLQHRKSLLFRCAR